VLQRAPKTINEEFTVKSARFIDPLQKCRQENQKFETTESESRAKTTKIEGWIRFNMFIFNSLKPYWLPPDAAGEFSGFLCRK
jgi:hypothetical protein